MEVNVKEPLHGIKIRMISGFRHNEDEICTLLGCYAALDGDSVPMFWENLSVPSSGVKKSYGTDRLSQNVDRLLDP